MLSMLRRTAVGVGLLLLVPLLTTPAGAGARAAAAGEPDPGPRAAAATAALQRVERMLDGTAPQDGRSLTMALRDLRVAEDFLPPAQRARARAIAARPTNDDILGVADWTRSCASDVCVHYARRGANASSPSYARTVLRTVQRIHDRYVAAGYRAPLGDGTRGGSGKLDVYLEDLGGRGIYGYCGSDDPRSPAETGSKAVWAYCGLDNDYDRSEYPRNAPLDNMRVTAAHEYFHAVQFAYDAYEQDWLLEATATWVEDEMYDGVNDNRQYFPVSPLARPDVPLDFFGDSGFQYGTWILFRRLSETWPASRAGLPVMVRDLFRRLDGTRGAPDDTALQALSRVLSRRGSSLEAALLGFALANRFPARFYEEGRAYPSAPGVARRLGPDRRTAAPVGLELAHLTSRAFRFVPDGLTRRGWRLRISLRNLTPARRLVAAVTIRGTDGRFETRRVPVGDQATVELGFGSRAVRSVELVVVNATRSDGARIAVSARAVRR